MLRILYFFLPANHPCKKSCKKRFSHIFPQEEKVLRRLPTILPYCDDVAARCKRFTPCAAIYHMLTVSPGVGSAVASSFPWDRSVIYLPVIIFIVSTTMYCNHRHKYRLLCIASNIAIISIIINVVMISHHHYFLVHEHRHLYKLSHQHDHFTGNLHFKSSSSP
jgi:hypothetical protein